MSHLTKFLKVRLSFLLIQLFLINSIPFYGQSITERLNSAKKQVTVQEESLRTAKQQVEELRLAKIREDLNRVGLPTGEVIEHSALFLAYDEDHEQASWVAHIIHPAVTTGTAYRSNDFRPDPLVPTGTAIETDYFLKYLQPDSTYQYDGYGFDRGHLAPSADFRWSEQALSESYFYSNMSPQRPKFNREGWAELEYSLRGYVYDHPGTQLFVVTGPVLSPDLPKVERSTNGVSIPERFFKVAYDPIANRGIAFVIPNEAVEQPLEHYAMSIDAAEEITGLDFFNRIADQAAFEATYDAVAWLPTVGAGDVAPFDADLLARGLFNTVQARGQAGKSREVTVVGTVVSTRYSRSGNLWLNLDKKFPNQIFSVFIRKKDLANFSYDPQAVFEGKAIAVTGTVSDFNGVPTMNLAGEEYARLYTPSSATPPKK